MAIYDFKCMKCQRIFEDVVLPMTHRKSDIPLCCEARTAYHITKAPSVVWKDPTIPAFRPVATENAPVISTMKEHREYMARNELVDANDTFSPPTQKEQRLAREEAKESIDAMSGTAQQKEQLREQGIDSIID